jgi:hypothetical protein
MAKKHAPTITDSLLTTIARTVGTTAGIIVNKTAELTEVARRAAGETIKDAPAKPSFPKKRKAVARKQSAKKTRAPRKKTDEA